jgi:hypothetical protein
VGSVRSACSIFQPNRAGAGVHQRPGSSDSHPDSSFSNSGNTANQHQSSSHKYEYFCAVQYSFTDPVAPYGSSNHSGSTRPDQYLAANPHLDISPLANRNDPSLQYTGSDQNTTSYSNSRKLRCTLRKL